MVWVFPGHRRCLADSKSCIPPCVGCISCYWALPDPSDGLQKDWNWGPQSAAVEGSTAVQRDIWIPEVFLLCKQPNEPLFLQVEMNNNKWWFLPKEGLVWKWGFLENWSPWLWGSAQLFTLIDKESLAHVVWCRGLALVSFVSQDIKSVIRDHLIVWGDFSGRKGTLELVRSWEHCVPENFFQH